MLRIKQLHDTVQEQATRLEAQAVHQRVWDAYHAPSKRAFSQRLRRLKEWAETALPDCAMKSHTLDLCDKRTQISQSYDHLYAHRTSNLVDQLMKFHV